MHPLDGIRAKIARAHEHLETLNREFDNFMHPNDNTPWGFNVQLNFDQGECAIVWKQDAPTPLRWSVILGEFLYDLRSSLDHLARLLVIANGRKPTNRTEFPVFRREDDFEERSCPKTKGMSAEVKTLIEESQPYREWPEHPESTTLWAIHSLGNTDKHRLLHLTDPWLFTMNVTFLIPSNVDQSLIRATRRPQRMRLYNDAEVAAFEWNPSEMRALGEADVQMNLQATLDVALAEGQWAKGHPGQPTEGMAVRHLMEIGLNYMEARLIPRFEPFV